MTLRRSRSRALALTLLIAAIVLVATPTPAHAYIGPGAGFAVASSFFAVFAALFSAFLTILTWPLQLLRRAIRGARGLKKSRFKRVVILGLDGMDYGLTEKMLEAGKLPNFARLRDQGSYKPLGSTLPPISPVAWSSFQTGTNPGKHNVFDFLTPDLNTYAAKLASVEIRAPRRVLKFGKRQFALGKPEVKLTRKSKPFWSVLSDEGITCGVLRVPITFPPEKVQGVLLSAMCAPDLRGTQGMFSYYTTRPKQEGEKIGGETHYVQRQGKTIAMHLVGPTNPFLREPEELKLPFTATLSGPDSALLKINGKAHVLKKDVYTPWIQVSFACAPGMTIKGICKFLLLETEPDFGLYVTPINIDPENPAMPVGYPSVYSIYLAKKQGPFATLGLAEDTWALNEGVISDDQFIEQCIDADNEREAMFFDILDKIPSGLCVCVFDGTDRLQHTFWRDIDEKHPARPDESVLASRNVVEDLYIRMDDLVGRTMAKCNRKDNLLFVISDHGFGPFRRGIDLNLWLERNGWLTFSDPAKKPLEHLAGVDWSRTRAFAIGLAGIYINLKDKYAQGIVEPEEADALRDEIAGKLGELIDPATGQRAIRRGYVTSKIYKGPYKDNGPDIVVGYERGYRVSWENAIGKTTDAVFHDNKKAWSGDHCVDPSLVPGILFCNRPIQSDRARLMDIGPTALDVFGVSVPDYMDGKPLEVGGLEDESRTAPAPEVVEAVS